MNDKLNTKEYQIHKASMKILDEVGIKFHNEKAVEVLKNNGIRMEGSVAKFSEDEIMRWVEKAPSHCTLHARNPRYNVVFGGDRVNHAPGYGCAFIAEKDGSQREGTIYDYIKCAKLYHANDDFNIVGGIMVQPNDVPQDSAPLDMFYSTFTHSEKAMFIATGEEKYVRAMMRSMAEVYGGFDEMVRKPRLITLVNTNSPLGLDRIMLDNIMVFAEYGQPVVVAPSTMLGLTGPVTIAGTLASSNAEVLAGIALAQMIRPGTPILYGMQSTGSDMRMAQIAGASPEGTLIQGFGGKMAKYYKLPCRGGGCMTDSPTVNAQAGYESMMTCFSSYMNKINFVIHSGGIVAGFNALSFEKMIIDFEVIRYVKRCFRGFEVNEDTLALDLIKEKGHSGEFLTSDHTWNNFRSEIYTPMISTRGNVNNPMEEYDNAIEKEIDNMIRKYDENRPEIDKEDIEKVRRILGEAGIEKDRLDYIDSL